MPDSSSIKPALVRLLRVAYPHASFPDGPYERVADKIIAQLDEDLWHKLALEHGLETLDAAAQEAGGSDFVDLDEIIAEKLLQDLADAEFFQFIRGVTVTTLYDDHEVWDLVGYEGGSYDQGGYLHRGFDDLDWLPDPRVEEYDGEPLADIAEHDQPANA